MEPTKYPSTLYRYYSNIEYANQLLTKGELHFASPSTFNDPYDFFPSIDSIKDFAKTLKPPQGRSKQDYLTDLESWGEKEQLETAKMLRRIFKVCCFTENNDNFRLWSYYANGFKGCCVGFDVEKMRNSKNLALIEKVKYVTERPSFQGMDSNHEQLKVLAFRKNIEYESENEWRCVKLSTISIKKLSCPDNGLINIDSGIMNELILGSEITQNNAAKLVCSARKKNIPLFQISTEPASNNYKLIKTHLNKGR